MHTPFPQTLPTFEHWPSWLNARGHLDRSACFEIRVSDLRRLAGCIPMRIGKRGNTYRDKGRAELNVPDLPNERRAASYKGRISCGWYDLSPYQMNALARLHMPRGLGGDWRTGRAPAMRRGEAGTVQGAGAWPGMTLEQGGYGPGSYAYERKTGGALDAGLTDNPNRGASREKKFGLDLEWVQRVVMEKWSHLSVSGVQYFLICPGVKKAARPRGDVSPGHLSSVDRKGLKGLTGTTSNCGDGSKGAHGKGWVCGQRVYKLFWVMAREGEVRDALFAEQWIAGLTSGQLSRRSAEVSALIDRYGPIMGDDRQLRCRRCLRLRYGQSPEVLRRKRRRRAGDRG